MVKKYNCPNCGAPINMLDEKCQYCDTKFSELKKQEEEPIVKTKTQHHSNFDYEGCMKSLMTLGLIMFFRGGGPRRRR